MSNINPTQERWWAFIKGKWKSAHHIKYIGDYVSAFPALIAATKQDFPSWDFSVPNEELTKLTKDIYTWDFGITINIITRGTTFLYRS